MPERIIEEHVHTGGGGGGALTALTVLLCCWCCWRSSISQVCWDDGSAHSGTTSTSKSRNPAWCYSFTKHRPDT